MPRGKRAKALSLARPTTCAATTLLARAFRPRSCVRRSCIPRPPLWKIRFWRRCSTRAQPVRSRCRARRTRHSPCCVPRSLRCWCAVSSTAGTPPLRRSTLPIALIIRRATSGRPSRPCSPGSRLPMASRRVIHCLRAMSFACAMAGSSATICCATSQPFRLAGMLAAQGRSIPCAPPSTASRCARCPLNVWRRAPHGCCSRCWSTCSSNLPSSTCSTIVCSTWS